MFESVVRVVVSHIEDPSKFWCQRSDQQSRDHYLQMGEVTGPLGCKLNQFDSRLKVRKGQLVMALFSVDSSSSAEYYRAKVLNVNQSQFDIQVLVHFIDYGNASYVVTKDLKMVPGEFLSCAPMAFECRLKGIAPKLIKDLKGNWIGLQEANV